MTRGLRSSGSCEVTGGQGPSSSPGLESEQQLLCGAGPSSGPLPGVMSQHQKGLLCPGNGVVPSCCSLTSRCKLAQSNGWGVMVSHRSGETEDTFIADLVVGLCTGQVRAPGNESWSILSDPGFLAQIGLGVSWMPLGSPSYGQRFSLRSCPVCPGTLSSPKPRFSVHCKQT